MVLLVGTTEEAMAIFGGCQEGERKKAMWWNSGGSWKERDGINWMGWRRLAVAKSGELAWDRWNDGRVHGSEVGKMASKLCQLLKDNSFR